MNNPLAPFRRAASAPQQLIRAMIRDPRRIDGVLAGLEAETAKTRFGCAKALRGLSEARPDLLYPHFNFFVRLLDHPNKIFQWEAALVISQLVQVDSKDKFRAISEKYFAPVSGPVMITAANVIRGAARIAEAKPQWADRIAAEVLKVNQARYQTPECRNVAIGHALLALSEFCDLLEDPAPVLRFARKQATNSRPATRKKAQQLLRKLERRGVPQTESRQKAIVHHGR